MPNKAQTIKANRAGKARQRRKQAKRKSPHQKSCRVFNSSNSSIKSGFSLTNTGANSFSINSNCSASNRLAKVRILKDGEAAAVKYFTNALGRQVFKSEPKPDQYLPSATKLGTGFVNWLKTNFGWLYAQAQVDASRGARVF